MAGQSFIKRWFLRVALIAFGAVIALTFKFLYNKSHKPARTFQTETASKQDIVKKTVATGAIVPRQEVEIKPRVSGVIEELYVEPNTVVKTGQKIARIKIVPNAASLNQAESSVRSAKIALDNAKRELDRNQALFEKGVIPEAELARFKTEYALRKQDYDSAGQQLQIVREGQARGGAASNAIVTSTVDGMVIDVPIKVGFSVIESNNFNPGTTIATVADMNDMIFDGQVDESEVGKIHIGPDGVGPHLRIKIGALEGQQYDGQLEYISPKGKTVDGAIQFEIKGKLIRKGDEFIRANYSANADIVLDERKQVVAIREALVQYDETGGSGDPGGSSAGPGSGSGAGSAGTAGSAGSAGSTGGSGPPTKGKPYVEVETSKPQVFARRDVQLGLSDGINVEVLGGITPTDKIKVPDNAGPPGMAGSGGPRRRGGGGM